MSADTVMSLRERTKAAMRDQVSEVAFELFMEQGFEKTTVEQIAAKAGLSRTTFFRYFGNKQEIVLERFNAVGSSVALALAGRPNQESPWIALRRSFDVVTNISLADTAQSLAQMQLLSDACALLTRHWEKTQGWQPLLVPEVMRRVKGTDKFRRVRSTAMVAAAISCLDAATDEWTACEGETSLATFLDEAMESLSTLG